MPKNDDKRRSIARDFDTIQPAFKRPIWLWDIANGSIIWANGPGVEFWCSRSLENLQNKRLDRALPAWSTIEELASQKLPPEGLSTPLTFWIDQDANQDGGKDDGKSTKVIEATAHCRSTDLNGSTNAIVVEILAYRVKSEAADVFHTSKGDSAVNRNSDMKSEDGLPKNATEQASQTSPYPKETLKNIQTNRPIMPVTPLPSLEGEQDVLLTDTKSTEQALSSNQSLEALAARIMARRKELETRAGQEQPPKPSNEFPPLQTVETSRDRLSTDTQNYIRDAKGDFETLSKNKDGSVASSREADVIYPIDHSGKDKKPSETRRTQTPLTKTPLSNYYYPRGDAHFDQKNEPPILEPSTPVLDGEAAPDDQGKPPPSNLGLEALSQRLSQQQISQASSAQTADEQPPNNETAPTGNPLVQTAAICSLDHIFYADDRFVQHFGYGTLEALKQDGLDWILPGIRPLLMPAFVGTGPSKFETVGRNRAGRKFNTVLQVALSDETDINQTDTDQTLLSLHVLEDEISAPTAHQQDKPSGAKAVFSSSTPSQTTPLPTMSQPIKSEDTLPILATISHELRTPLNVIIGFCEMIQTQQFGSLNHPRYESYLDDIHTSAKDAVDLIDSMLDFAKLHANAYDFEPQELDLNQIIRSELRLMRSLAIQSDIVLRSDCQENLPLIQSDKRGIKMIISNLLSNAIKYNRKNGTVKISTSQNHPNRLTLDIVDTGVGLNEKELDQALQPFVRLNSATKGTGLGLPFTKALCEAIGAQFQISSTKDKGTSVHISFPLLRDDIDK